MWRWLAAALVALIAAEAASALAFRVVLHDRLAVHWRVAATDLAGVTDADVARYREQFFDPVLGWVFGPRTTAIDYATFLPDGARADPVGGPGGRVAAYGDSFTFGEDVPADATWPHDLSMLLGSRVANYGVAGYGPDQALLRLRRNLEAGDRPEVVVLGMLSENIARIVNRWRHEYTVSGELLSFKPRLIADANGAHWLPSPLPELRDRASVAAAAAAAADHDFWSAYNETRPAPRPPYLWAALDTADYLARRVLRWQDLWSLPEPVATFQALMDEFTDLGRQYGFRPVLVMIPMPEDLHARDRGVAPSYAAAVATAQRSNAGLAVVDVLAADFDRARFNLRPYSGHASPYGNQVIADAVGAALP